MCINGTLPLPHKWLPFPHGLRSTDISPTRGCTPATTVLEDLINAMIPWSLSLSLYYYYYYFGVDVSTTI